MIVVSGLFLHIPWAIDKRLDPQLVNAVLAQMVVDNFLGAAERRVLTASLSYGAFGAIIA